MRLYNSAHIQSEVTVVAAVIILGKKSYIVCFAFALESFKIFFFSIMKSVMLLARFI